MSRQTDRAKARHTAKVAAGEARVASRVAARIAKGLTPLGKSEAAGYPQSTYKPVQPTGKIYAEKGKREAARNLRRKEAAYV